MAETPLVQIHHDGPVTVIEFGAQVRLIEEPVLEKLNRELLDAVQAADPPLVIFDMTNTEFFGSSFIETLFRVWNRIQQKPGGKFALCGMRTYCKEVLEITHLDKLWPILDTRAAAVEQLSA